MRTVVSVVGARPQFVKLAPVARALDRAGDRWRHRIVHTGQHYDYEMSDLFFDELHIPRADVNLGVGSASHGRQTGAMLSALEEEFTAHPADVVLTYGDTNSTLAATLAAAKQHLRVCHIEAGLRSYDRSMPEEINRIAADHCSDRLYAPTPRALENLAGEGLADRAIWSGDVMLDAVRYYVDRAAARDVRERHGLDGVEFGVLTIHRQANTQPAELIRLVSAVEEAAQGLTLLFPMHPRTKRAFERASVSHENLVLISPLGYLDMLGAVRHARIVITDSGGLQKEAAFLGTPCVTLRETTEWTETLTMGANRLVGRSREAIRVGVDETLNGPVGDWSAAVAASYGDGAAAVRIVDDLDTPPD